jgi:hypothetical protein
MAIKSAEAELIHRGQQRPYCPTRPATLRVGARNGFGVHPAPFRMVLGVREIGFELNASEAPNFG